jgi:dipeptidase E
LKQAKNTTPKILFLPTAGNDPEDYIERFYLSYQKLNCFPSHISLSKISCSISNLEKIILSNDIIFVGGGNPEFLIQTWNKFGVDKILKKAWLKGIVLSGMSAGAMCWFKYGFSSSYNDSLKKINCLGFLKGSFCPHYNSNNTLKNKYKDLLSKKIISNGYGVEDGVALHFINNRLAHIVSSRPDTKAYFICKPMFRLSSKTINPIFLSV